MWREATSGQRGGRVRRYRGLETKERRRGDERY